MPEKDGPPAMCCFVLGTPSVRNPDGERVEITADKPRRLLGELLLHRDSWVETDALIDVLWTGENQPQSARGNLKTYVHQLRQSLPPQPDGSARLLSRRGGYRLVVAADELDAGVFEMLVAGGREALRRGDVDEAVRMLREALGLWHGRPYTQVPSPAAEAEAARLDELHKITRDALADALIAVGNPSEAVTILGGLTAEEPLREGSWRRLLTALRADGRPADALAAFERVRRILDDELGTTPGPELTAIHEQLLAEPRTAAPEPRTAAPEPRTAAPEPRTAAPEPSAPDPGPATGTGPATDTGGRRRHQLVLAGALGSVLVVALVVAGVLFTGTGGAGSPPQRSAAAEVDDYPPSVAERRPVPGYPAPASAAPALRFGMGHEANTAQESELVKATRVNMLTTWYDGRDDLLRYRGWSQDIIPGMYRSGKSLHLIIGTWQEQGTGPVRTRYGPACGQRYPLTDQFLDDMRSLATSFAGRATGPPLYVSVYDGLEKLACSPEGYLADKLNTAYYRAVQDRYLKVVKIFHRYAPNARVGLNWEGWEATGDDPASGDGRSMFPYFARELRASDFVSFSAYEPGHTARNVRASVAALRRFRLPIMLSYYEPYTPDGTDPAAASAQFDSDMRSLFTPASVRALTGQGLFAWSFKRPMLLERSPESYRLAADAVQRYGHP